MHKQRVFSHLEFESIDKRNKKFVNCVFKGCNFYDVWFSHCTFENCTFENCYFHKGILRYSRFENVTLKLCEFYDVLLIGNTLHFEEIVGCRFADVESLADNNGFWYFGSFNEISYCVATVKDKRQPIVGGSMLPPLFHDATRLLNMRLIYFLYDFSKEY